MIKHQYLIGLFFAASVVACKEAKKTSESEDVLKPAVHLAEADSLEAGWLALDSLENEKIISVKRLLDEISYMKSYDVAKHAAALTLLDSAKALKLTPNQVSDTSLVDAYDLLISTLVSDVNMMVANNPHAGAYPLCGQLLSDINALETQTISFRVNYDRALKSYQIKAQEYEKNDESARLDSYKPFMAN